jgi:hypothetical protein
MRIFCYGMQSSGASLVTLFLAQTPRTVAVVDLLNAYLMPRLEIKSAEHVVAKAVVTTSHSIDSHKSSFQPDRTVLILRDPLQNYVALRRKYYANESGTIDDKFAVLENVHARTDAFDVVLRYEDFVLRPHAAVEQLKSAGLPVEVGNFTFPRSREELKEFAFEQCDWCRENYESRWKFGNVQGREPKRSSVYKYVPRAVAEHVRTLCPKLVTQYDEYYNSIGLNRFDRYRMAVLHDVVVPASNRAINRLRRIGTSRL